MLQPDNRQLLVDTLRPPDGYHLDQAIGTTYSLDLLTLLTIPLNFTLLEWRSADDGHLPHPLAMLNAIRRFAEKLVVFCQAGQIYVPKQHQLLYSNLEQSVIEVGARKPEYVFHPKVWTLRFRPTHTDDDNKLPIRYRVIVLSRNITFDKSWDTILRLDGQLTDRTNAFSRNHPLGDFIETLPDLAVGDVPDSVLGTIDRVQHEIRRVEFELPDDICEIEFWPAGLTTRHTWPFEGRRDRTMVISPFLSDALLNRLAPTDNDVLISRLEAISHLDPETQRRFGERFVLSDYAQLVDETAISGSNDPLASESPDPAAGEPLVGLHAKVFVADAGWDARIWTGSANATSAAFSGNVEFMVEMRGRKSRIGIDALLGGEDEMTLRSLLQPVEPIDRQPVDPDAERLEALVTKAWRAISRAALRIDVRASEQPDSYQMVLRKAGDTPFPLPPGVRVRSRPITWNQDNLRDVDVTTSEIAQFEPVSLEAITPFIAFHIETTCSGQSMKREFVRNLPLKGAPEERESSILRALFRNQNDFLRYLLMLLVEGDVESGDAFEIASALGVRFGSRSDHSWRFPLFEALVRALHRHPESLEEIARLVDDLTGTPDGRELLPNGFEQIWEPIWQTRRQTSL